MITCGKKYGGAIGYGMVCGHLWMGDIYQCPKCKSRQLKQDILIKQNKLLDIKLNSYQQNK